MTDAPAPARASFLRNASVMMGSQTITWSLSLLITVMIPRFLGPSVVGEFRVAVALWAIADTVTAFGTSTTITVALARDANNGRVVGDAILCRLLLFGLSLVTLLGFVTVADYDTTVLILVLIIAVGSFLGILQSTATAAFYGLERMGPAAAADVAAKLFYAIAVVALLLVGGEAIALAVIGVCGTLVGVVMLTRQLRRVPGIQFLGSLRHVRPMLAASWAYFFNDLALVVYIQAATIVISLLATNAEVGWYTSAAAVFAVLIFVPVILMTTLFPMLARFHETDPEALRDLVRRSFGLLMLLAIPLGLGTVAIATPLSVLLYGEEFAETGPILAVLGIAIAFNYIAILLGRVATATGKQRFFGLLMMGAAVLSIPLNLLLVPWASRTFGNGGIGGALAFVLTELAIVGIAMHKLTPYLMNAGMRTRLLKCGLAGAVMFACCYPLRNDFILIPIAVGIVVYFVAIHVLRVLTPDEVAMVKNVGARALAPIRSKVRSVA